MKSSQSAETQSRAAFTLVELLVVLAIIAIIIAIVVPVLGNTRDSAKAVSTGNELKQITTAASVFNNDERRMPGYFTPRQMGRADNLTRGMSAMENVMLDLAGYQSGTSMVGPTNNPQEQLGVDPQKLGIGGQGKLYYTPDKKLYVAQITATQQIAQSPHADSEGLPDQLPDVVDYFGQPVLAWVSDETYVTRPGPSTNFTFARNDSGTGASGAKLYWASNACFLNAPQLGKKAVDQTTQSMISPTGANANKSLEGAFGNPRDPYKDPAALNDLTNVVPRSARSAFIVQSAGIDGTYFGKKDRGAKQFASGFIDYKMNFAPNPAQAISPANQYLDKDGKPTNYDVIEKFDDLFSYSGN